MKKMFFRFVVCFFVVLTITGCSDDKQKDSSSSNTSTGTNTNNDSSKPIYTPSELSKNMTSSGAVTEYGNLVVIAKNNNNVPVNVEIEVEFYDANGVILESDSNELQAVGSAAEIATEMWDTPEVFDNYKIYVDAEQTTNDSYFEQVELSHNNTGEEIAVQVKNNSQEMIDYITVSILYYQGDKIVGIDEENESDVKSGRAANFTFEYPYDKNYDDVTFDNYKVFITEAYSYNW